MAVILDGLKHEQGQKLAIPELTILTTQWRILQRGHDLVTIMQDRVVREDLAYGM